MSKITFTDKKISTSASWDGVEDVVNVKLGDLLIEIPYETCKDLFSKLEVAMFDEDDTYEVMQSKLSSLRIENEELKYRIELLQQ